MWAGNKKDSGILVIAFGSNRYVELAMNLSLSLKLNHNPYPVALVTDSLDPNLDLYFDRIVPIDPTKGSGFSQKMWMYEYSPFLKTLFIDADCLVVKNISFLFEWMDGKSVTCLGEKVFEGELLGTSLEKLRNFISFDFLPTFNGGVYYFEKSDLSKKTFELAREIFYSKYQTWDLWLFNGKPGDEPAMSIAMGHFNLEPVSDPKRITMYTPVGQQGVFEMDILSGYCRFEKSGIMVSPAIMHFGGGYPEAFHYKRELKKMKLHIKTHLPKALCSILVNGIYNPIYAAYVLFYRFVKFLMGRASFKVRPLIPMFKFE
jgi:hypothetical protein